MTPKRSPGGMLYKNAKALGLDAMLSEIERGMILKAIVECGGNKAEAARLLKVRRTTLIEKCKRLGIPLKPSLTKSIYSVGASE